MLFDVHFQKIVIPTPKRVSGNPKAKAEVGGGLAKANIFKGNIRQSRDFLDRVMGGGGVFKPTNPPCKGYRYFLEQHYMIFCFISFSLHKVSDKFC